MDDEQLVPDVAEEEFFPDAETPEITEEEFAKDGFIKVSRRLFKHWLFTEKREFSKFEAWIDLIQHVRYSETEGKALIDGQLRTWKRGQTIASLRFLAHRWHWKSKNKVGNFLKLLEKEGMITIEVQSKNATRLTLLNYDSYNSPEDSKRTAKGQQKDSKRTRRGQNSKKEERKKEEGSKKVENTEDGEPSPIVFETKGQSLINWIKKNTKHVALMEEQLTLEQAEAIAKELDSKLVKHILFAMDNYKYLNKNRTVNQTLRNWYRRELERNGNNRNSITTFNHGRQGKGAISTEQQEILNDFANC